MRPPILFLTVAFGVGLYAGLDPSLQRGAWYVVVPVLGAALLIVKRAPLGAAVGVMGVAGTLWGAAAGREREATCAGRWGRETGEEGWRARAAIVLPVDPAPASGGGLDADRPPRSCGGGAGGGRAPGEWCPGGGGGGGGGGAGGGAR